MPFAELATGIRMYYEQHGQGEPLVLVHGTGGSHELWDPLVGDFARHFTLILPDPRGTGQTDKPVEETWPMALLAGDLAGLLDALDCVSALSRAVVASNATRASLVGCPSIRRDTPSEPDEPVD
jgi:pimeloyl-ACP methyl ester carboxylesterase